MSQKGPTAPLLLLLLLLLVNGLLLAAVLGGFGPDPLAGWMESPREPQRVSQQVRGERMRLEPPADTATGRPAPAGSPRGALAPSPSGSVSLAVAKPAPRPDACFEIGGFSAQTVARAREDLAAIAAGAALPVQQFERTEQVRWWVHLPAQPTRENADRKLAELKRRKVTDVSVVSNEDGEASSASYTVSLGLFRERERADRFLESLRAQGVRTALITDAPRPVARQWLRVTTTDDAVRARMDEVRLRYGAESLQACRAGTQARGAKQPGSGAEG